MYGVEFGLLPTDPEFVEDEEDISLEFHPGNYMADFIRHGMVNMIHKTQNKNSKATQKMHTSYDR